MAELCIERLEAEVGTEVEEPKETTDEMGFCCCCCCLKVWVPEAAAAAAAAVAALIGRGPLTGDIRGFKGVPELEFPTFLIDEESPAALA